MSTGSGIALILRHALMAWTAAALGFTGKTVPVYPYFTRLARI
jgi:hypothetical protein